MVPIVSLLVLLPLAAAVPANSYHAARSVPGVVSVPLQKTSAAVAPSSRHLLRLNSTSAASFRAHLVASSRASPPSPPPHQGLVDRSEFYLAHIGIGNPPQPVSLLVDTSGWITWVNPSCKNALRQADCASQTAYSASKSSPPPTRVIGLDQDISYALGMGAALEGYADVFTWGSLGGGGGGGGGNSTGNGANGTAGGFQVPAQPFAVSYYSAGLSTAVLGLGPDGMDGFDSALSSFNVISTMARQGLIASRTFSLALGRLFEVGKETGALVFGGIDKNRFSGSLFRAPILPASEGHDGWRYWVRVSQVEHHRPDGKPGVRNTTSEWGSQFLLDSGTTGVYVERSIYDAILAETNLTRNQARREGFPDVDCSFRNVTGAFSFTFAGSSSSSSTSTNGTKWTNGTFNANSTATKGGVRTNNGTSSPSFTLRIPYASLVHPVAGGSGCFFALSSGGDAYDDGDIWPILGLDFFRSVFAVFDWDHREVALARGASCGSADLVALQNGTASLAGVHGNCKQNTDEEVKMAQDKVDRGW